MMLIGHLNSFFNLSRKHVIEGMQQSLKNLQMDYVDIVFSHRPDPNTPILETVRAFDFIINKGWAFYWGTSEWSAKQIEEAVQVASEQNLIAPVCEQPQYNMMCRTRVEVEYAKLYKEIGLGITTWSPLASGLLTGKYKEGNIPAGTRMGAQSFATFRKQFEENEGINGLEEKDSKLVYAKVAELAPIAKELGCTMAQLAIAWCIVNTNVSTVITGASNVDQVKENLPSLAVSKKLNSEYMAKIAAVLAKDPKKV